MLLSLGLSFSGCVHANVLFTSCAPDGSVEADVCDASVEEVEG